MLAIILSWETVPSSYKSLFETAPDGLPEDTKSSWMDCGKVVRHKQGFWRQADEYGVIASNIGAPGGNHTPPILDLDASIDPKYEGGVGTILAM